MSCMQSLMEFKGNLTVPNESESSSKTSKRAATLSTSRSDTDIRSVASLPDGVRIGTIMYFRKVQYIFSFLVFCLYTAGLCTVPWYMYYRTYSMGTMVYVLPYPFVGVPWQWHMYYHTISYSSAHMYCGVNNQHC